MPEDDPGLLGSLPRTRPGVESPRRAAARAAGRQGAGQEAPTERIVTEPAPRDESGIEQLARAGVGVAAGAAASGLRLAGRVVGGIGKAVGRR